MYLFGGSFLNDKYLIPRILIWSIILLSVMFLKGSSVKQKFVGVFMLSVFLDTLLCEVGWFIEAQRSSLKMTPYPVAVWILPARNECHCWILLYCRVDK